MMSSMLQAHLKILRRVFKCKKLPLSKNVIRRHVLLLAGSSIKLALQSSENQLK